MKYIIVNNVHELCYSFNEVHKQGKDARRNQTGTKGTCKESSYYKGTDFEV